MKYKNTYKTCISRFVPSLIVLSQNTSQFENSALERNFSWYFSRYFYFTMEAEIYEQYQI